MNNERLKNTINNFWDNQIIPTLVDYIKIPNKSPAFDSNWKTNGHMDRALSLATKWTKKHLPLGAELIIKESVGKTPLIMIDVPGKRSGNVLMYGHLDKQPEMEGWDEDKGPWKPLLVKNKLYGRGGADDGYALFASLCAIKALQEENVSLPRILVLIEFSEESGSPDLPHYISLHSKRIGSPNLVVCLDSGVGDYKRFWTTTSLRGLIGARLRVDVLKEGVHSGGASGYVPSSFRIARQILSRIEDQNSGEILLNELTTNIPKHRIKEAENFVNVLGDSLEKEFPWKGQMLPSTDDKVEGVLRRTWMPALSVVGAGGLPKPNNAGNVLRPYTELQLSIRIPPEVDHLKAQSVVEKTIKTAPPYNSIISVDFEEAAAGWNAPKTAPWLLKAMNVASMAFFNKQASSLGEGGTIPFMAMLGKQFPEAQFVITGVLGPNSNAHGPNEFLHISYAKKLTACVASILNSFQK